MIKPSKSVFLILISTIFLLGVIFGLSFDLVSAQGLVPCGTDSNDCDFNDVYKLVNNLINFFVFVLAVPIAVVVITIAGIWLVVYPSNESKRREALGMIKTAVIGLLIVLSAYLIVKALIFGLAGNSDIGNRLREVFE